MTAWNELSELAWRARGNARLIGKTKVGCAVLSKERNFYSGCNIEHKYRCHDIHAEPNTLSTMIGAGDSEATMILIVAEREFFTPCGGCLDWIFELGSSKTLIGFQNSSTGKIEIHTAGELMPLYPR